MATEIERKWLVPEFPAEFADRLPGDLIDQGYLVVAEEGSEVRVRRNPFRQFVTYKSGGGLSRTEIEVEITPEQFEQLWPATEGRRVEKHRVTLERGIEVDIYDGELSGLRVAEVEFDSEAAAAAFETPGWFGEEVTEDRRYKNQQLALRGLPSRD